ncbi:hypothetical protein K449DRAFT_460250 [Hypoxylon sp. EC38]|nr:hypothetical protein K449DRAFT_460250 [Hypoxylon sp. EC38]
MYTTDSFGFTTLSRPGPLDISDQPALQSQQSSYAEKTLKNLIMASLRSYGPYHGPITVPNPRPPHPKPKPKPQPAPTPVSHNQPVYLPNPRPPNPKPKPKPQPAPAPVSHTQPTTLPNPRPPNPKPKPKPQPAPTPVSHKQALPTLWTSPQIRSHTEAELSLVKRSLQEIVAREFKVPAPALIRMAFRLSPADVDEQGKLTFTQGRLWRATGREIWAPTIVVWLPEREMPEGKALALRNLRGLSDVDRENLARVARVEQAVRHGRGLEQYADSLRPVLEGLPVSKEGNLTHCGFEFRFGLTDIHPLTLWPTVMYLPVANWQVTIPLYERTVVRGEMDMGKLSSWAAKWNAELERDEVHT